MPSLKSNALEPIRGYLNPPAAAHDDTAAASWRGLDPLARGQPSLFDVMSLSLQAAGIDGEDVQKAVAEGDGFDGAFQCITEGITRL